MYYFVNKGSQFDCFVRENDDCKLIVCVRVGFVNHTTNTIGDVGRAIIVRSQARDRHVSDRTIRSAALSQGSGGGY